ncbi:MAG: flagellar hook capping protein [Ignavibacteriae bacterium HGW-Ignavibacteriae-2]|jgi:flagellar basal-body rod modification protein FlgD|nr:MAG: flagellar hook capping protein [Ignavibacteriae bacterium HGW-Ignavibacteriae-2]
MVDGVNSTTTSGYTTTEAGSNSELGKDDFLKLMITQMKYQDPMNPMDSNEYSAQLAQFSQLEQLTNLNDYMKQSIDANYLLTQSVNNTMTATLIGKEVRLGTDTIKYNGQEQVNFGYDLPVNAASVTVNIYDQYGNIVKTIQSDKKSLGQAKLSWDFTDNNGNKIQNGDYTFKVDAKSMDGQELTISNYVFGKLEGVRFGENGTNLIVNSVEYYLSDIEGIYDSNEGGN